LYNSVNSINIYTVIDEAANQRLNLRKWSNDWQTHDRSAISCKNYWPRV